MYREVRDMENDKEKELFFIAVTGKPKTLNREFTQFMCDLLNDDNCFVNEYKITTHDAIHCENLYNSLDDALSGDGFAGYLILLDMLDSTDGICNPNVMFEFGAIKSLGKPFAVMGTRDAEKYPFDVRGVNVVRIPSFIIDDVKKANKNGETLNISQWKDDLSNPNRKQLNRFCANVLQNFIASERRTKNEAKNTMNMQNKLDAIIKMNQELGTEVKRLSLSLEDSARYIDGESDAFRELKDAVDTATTSLRTSRFANQSIVKTPTDEQRQFMDSLYAKSRELKGNFHRIICNNNPMKWSDIYNILVNGGSGSRVYVRKADYSIYFELVVIDERIAFVHFYQKDKPNDEADRGTDGGVERINSTLKIQGRSTCRKFANIFDRLHHRDFSEKHPSEPSSTLLGVPREGRNTDNSKCGYFQVPDNMENMLPNEKHNAIMSMFKCAFKEWNIEGVDKTNMVVGISRLEGSAQFIEAMKEEGKLSAEEYKNAYDAFNSIQKTG